MLAKVREAWVSQVLAARQASQAAEKLRAFEGLTREQAARASYFTEMAGLIEALGLANPHEKTALSIEPTHPVPFNHMRDAAWALGVDPVLQTAWPGARLSLVSLPMLERYTGSSLIRTMRRSGLTSPLYLLDPLYGFAFFKLADGLHNHCLAIDIWLAHLESMPSSLG